MVQILGDTDVLRGLLGKSVERRLDRVINVLVIPPAGLGGAAPARELCVLATNGVDAEKFDCILAGSSGAIDAMTYTAGHQDDVPDMYAHLAGCWRGFAQTFWYNFHPYLFKELMGDIGEHGSTFNLGKVEQTPTRLIFATATMQGRIRFHDVKQHLSSQKCRDLLQSTASITPFLGRRIDGVSAIDPIYGHAFCAYVRKVREIARENPDAEIRILFLASRPLGQKSPTETLILNGLAWTTLWWSPGLLASVLDTDRKTEQSERVFHKKHDGRFRICGVFLEPEECIPNLDPFITPALVRERGSLIESGFLRICDAV